MRLTPLLETRGQADTRLMAIPTKLGIVGVGASVINESKATSRFLDVPMQPATSTQSTMRS
jgi:hypothetical protein